MNTNRHSLETLTLTKATLTFLTLYLEKQQVTTNRKHTV